MFSYRGRSFCVRQVILRAVLPEQGRDRRVGWRARYTSHELLTTKVSDVKAECRDAYTTGCRVAVRCRQSFVNRICQFAVFARERLEQDEESSNNQRLYVLYVLRRNAFSRGTRAGHRLSSKTPR